MSSKKFSAAPQQWTFGGMQQIGVGAKNFSLMKSFYTGLLGFDIPMFDEEGSADKMKRYTGGAAQTRRAALLANLRGGAAIELWSYRGRCSVGMDAEAGIANKGILAACVRCACVRTTREYLQHNGCNVTKISTAPDGSQRFYCKDPEENWVGIFQTSEGWFIKPPRHVKSAQAEKNLGGICSALIGVSDMKKALSFYQTACGYAEVVYDESGVFDEFDAFQGQQKIRRVLLRAPKTKGAFSHLLQSSSIELVQALEAPAGHIYGAYDKRFWGDPGFIHVCFDVKNTEALKSHCHKRGIAFTVDTGGEQDFLMDEAAGRFAYVEDPDRTLVEFVEVYKLPLLARPKISLNLKKRAAGKPLPAFLIRLFAAKRERKTGR